MSIRIIPAVRRASESDFIYPLKFKLRLATASRRTANVPTAPASVGVKKPYMIPPMTRRKTRMIQATSGSERNLAFQVDRSDMGAIFGLIFTHP